MNHVAFRIFTLPFGGTTGGPKEKLAHTNHFPLGRTINTFCVLCVLPFKVFPRRTRLIWLLSETFSRSKARPMGSYRLRALGIRRGNAQCGTFGEGNLRLCGSCNRDTYRFTLIDYKRRTERWYAILSYTSCHPERLLQAQTFCFLMRLFGERTVHHNTHIKKTKKILFPNMSFCFSSSLRSKVIQTDANWQRAAETRHKPCQCFQGHRGV